jgi:hypothetical protein
VQTAAIGNANFADQIEIGMTRPIGGIRAPEDGAIS